MSISTLNRFASVVALTAALAGAGSIAHAGLVGNPPQLEFSLQVGDGIPIEFYPIPTNTGPYSWNWSGSYYDDNNYEWSMPEFSIDGDTDPFVNAFISLINNTAITQTYTLIVTLPVTAIPGGTLMDGSIGTTVTDADGSGFAEIAATAGDSIYKGLIDGANPAAANLLIDPFTSNTFVSGGSNTVGSSFGQPVKVAGPAVVTDIGIRLHFTLTPGDSVGITAFFRVLPVPGPGGLALLGFAGLFGRSRRR